MALACLPLLAWVPMSGWRGGVRGLRHWGTALLLALWALPAASTPVDYMPLGSPPYAELRILDCYHSDSLRGRFRLPHLNTLPIQPIELQGLGPPVTSPSPVIGISLARLERAMGRDRVPLFAPHPVYQSTPRIYNGVADDQVLQISAGFSGAGLSRENAPPIIVSGSGLVGRISMGIERLAAYSEYVVGRIENARAFSDPIIPDNDLIVLPDDTYLSFTEELGRWSARFGRGRWHLGPGQEGSLVLSQTSPTLTGLAFRANLRPLRADLIAISATLKQAAGEQLAAHRFEWQPMDWMRVGVSEAARYHGTGWKPLYLVGAIPYVIVQRLERQYEVDSLRSVRNNVLTAADLTLRLFPGFRGYGEILIDDIHARSGKLPNKIGYQFGWDGAFALGSGRILHGAELTRLTRYVYTSFFGRDYVVDDRSIGYPYGPDLRRVMLRAGWDPNVDWNFTVRATHTDKGENDLDEPFLPNSPRVDAFQFEGVVENLRDVEGSVTWGPASGVELGITVGKSWTRNAGHVAGARTGNTWAGLQVTLMR